MWRQKKFPLQSASFWFLMITRSGTGRSTIEFEASGRFPNPMGTLHGGVLCDLADAAMGVAYSSTLAEGETFTTIELKMNFYGQSGTGSFALKREWFVPARSWASSN